MNTIDPWLSYIIQNADGVSGDNTTYKGFAFPLKFIQEGPYEDVIHTMMEHPTTILSYQEALLKRIKDEDLPLFINYDWENQFEKKSAGYYNTDLKEIFLNRLKGVNPCSK